MSAIDRREVGRYAEAIRWRLVQLRNRIDSQAAAQNFDTRSLAYDIEWIEDLAKELAAKHGEERQ